MTRISVIDSHTAGEPTRVVLEGAPDLGTGPLVERLARFRDRHDDFRRAVILEPRGSDVLVGALLLEPFDSTCIAGVIFFNNVGVLNMCGHGIIGLVSTLAHLKRLGAGEHRIETAVGIVTTTLHADGSVSVANVPSYRKHKGLKIDLRDSGAIEGDIAWGGNWFFLAERTALPLDLASIETLINETTRIRLAVNAQGFEEVDHIELFGPPREAGHSRNFVLCPGKAYDRSPCGTGTSAKLACLAADGQLAEGAAWVQESIVGSTFVGRYRWLDRTAGTIIPVITGTAFLTAETTLLLDERDPFCWGIR